MRHTILLLAGLCFAPLVVFAGDADSTESDMAVERPCDARNVLISGSASVTHFAGDDYGGEGLSVTSIDGLVALFATDHILLGALVSIRESNPEDWWDRSSFGPIIGVYFDPNRKTDITRGSVLPYVRLFGQIGKTEMYSESTTYTAGGDIGIVLMAGGSLGVDIAFRASRDWTRNIFMRGWDVPLNPVDRQTTTVRLAIGLSGFIR